MNCEVFSEEYVRCIREGRVVPDEFFQEAERRVEASREQGLSNPTAWARLKKSTFRDSHAGVILDNDYDRQAVEELGLSEVDGPLEEADARKILNLINRRANQRRTHAERGYGSTEG